MSKPKTQLAKLEKIPALTPAPNPAKNGPGQPKALDDKKQATICSLVSDGVSLRQAARYIGCDPKSIRREAHRNEEFRVALKQARTAAKVDPIQTLRRAANDDWRAALSWLRCTDPDRFARRNDSIVTKREANAFVDFIFDVIDEVIPKIEHREIVYQRLSPGIPFAMQTQWNLNATDHAEALAEFKRKQQELDASNQKKALEIRKSQREQFFRDIIQYLPRDVLTRLKIDANLLDPDEVRAQIDELTRRKAAANASSGSPVQTDPAKTTQTTDANKASQ